MTYKYKHLLDRLLITTAVFVTVFLSGSMTVNAGPKPIPANSSPTSTAPTAGAAACSGEQLTNGTTACCEQSSANCVAAVNCSGKQVFCADTASECTGNSAGKCDLIARYINPAITLLSAVVGVVVVMSIIYGGIQYSTSAGDPQKAAKAKMHITKTVFALIAYIFLFSFLQFILPGGILHKGS